MPRKKTTTPSKIKKIEPVPVFETPPQIYVEEEKVFVEYKQNTEEKKENKKRSFNFTKLIAICLIIVCLVGLFLFVKSKKLTKNSAAANEKRVKEAVLKVEKLIDLPKNELPSLAIVEDVEMLKDQPFFADSRKGDIVLMYGIAQKVFLYNPSDNLIINVSSLGVNEQK